MSRTITLPQLEERVLSTLNADGTRRWMQPRGSYGRFWKARLAVAIALIAIFTALPWIRINGKPPILLDVMLRQFTFLGTTFRPTETLLLAILLLTVFVSIFLLTALFGRVWCGWACPQTVYLEFVYRPLEKLFLGAAYGRSGAKVAAWRRILLYGTYLLLSAHLANTFLAYFVGTDRLTEWTMGSPARHPVAFGVFAVTTGLMLFDFVFFREQLCTLVCPYGRMQSVLLDRDSLIVAYDRTRGEPRGRAAARKAMEAEGRQAGDCVECTMCTQVCPTGIDIRDGLQLECVQCAQCIDACDDIMAKLGKPGGLIRYSTQNRIEHSARGGFRYRLVLYPALLVGLVALLAVLLSRRAPVLIEQERLVGANFSAAADGSIETPIRLLVENRTESARTFTVRGAGDVAVAGAFEPVAVPPASAATFRFSVRAPAASFGRGSRHGTVELIDDLGAVRPVDLSIAGPFNAVGPAGSAR
jgi:cytochrome c oxidase accessory protein FixG